MISRLLRFLGHFMPTQEGELSVSQSDGKARIYRGAAVRVLEDQGNKGAANGYPSLDGSALVPTSQLGTGTANSTTFLRGDGTWAAGGGGGGVTDHTALTSLGWTASGHTGTANRVAGFGGAGAAAYLTGRDVCNFVLTTRGDMMYRDATEATRLPIGAANRLLMSDGTDPAWASPADVRTALDAERKVRLTDGAAVTRTIATLNDGEFLKVSGGSIISAAVNVAAFIALTDGFDQDPDEDAFLTPVAIFMSNGTDA